MNDFEKVIIITKKTAMEELIERFNTKAQAAFYLESMGVDFSEYQAAHNIYIKALESVKSAIPAGTKFQCVERSFLPSFLPGENDLIITLGPDGLVVNTAKYLSTQPIMAINPDPSRIDGVLLPYNVNESIQDIKKIINKEYSVRKITMAKAEFNDGQKLYALNDFFIGQKSHLSARYSLSYRGKRENQSSSGIIVSTGAGSTGWFRSIVTGASAFVEAFGGLGEARVLQYKYQFDWEAAVLYFSVREPFISRTSSAGIVFGKIEDTDTLEITSYMPGSGVVFSDGIENDYIEFNSGSIVQIGLAERSLHLIVKSCSHLKL